MSPVSEKFLNFISY